MSGLFLIASIWQPNALSLVTEHAEWVETLSTNRHSKCTEGNVLITATLCMFVVVILHGCILFTFGLVDFPVGTWWSYTKQWEMCRSKIHFSFSLPCCVLSFFFFLFSLAQGWSKGAYLIKPFHTGRLCNLITGQNYYEQLKLEIFFDTEKCI